MDGDLISAYYHPSKEHRATTLGKNGLIRNTVLAFEWAISVQEKLPGGNRSFYNTSPYEGACSKDTLSKDSLEFPLGNTGIYVFFLLT